MLVPGAHPDRGARRRTSRARPHRWPRRWAPDRAGLPNTSPCAFSARRTALWVSPGGAFFHLPSGVSFCSKKRPDRANNTTLWIGINPRRAVTTVGRTKPGTILSTGLLLQHHCRSGLLPLLGALPECLPPDPKSSSLVGSRTVAPLLFTNSAHNAPARKLAGQVSARPRRALCAEACATAGLSWRHADACSSFSIPTARRMREQTYGRW